MESGMSCEWAPAMRDYLEGIGLDASTVAYAANDLCEITEDCERLHALIADELRPALESKNHDGISIALIDLGIRVDHTVGHLSSLLSMLDRVTDAIDAKFGELDDERGPAS